MTTPFHDQTESSSITIPGLDATAAIEQVVTACTHLSAQLAQSHLTTVTPGMLAHWAAQRTEQPGAGCACEQEERLAAALQGLRAVAPLTAWLDQHVSTAWVCADCGRPADRWVHEAGHQPLCASCAARRQGEDEPVILA